MATSKTCKCVERIDQLSGRKRVLVMFGRVAALTLFLFFSFPCLASVWHNNVGVVQLTRRFSGQGVQTLTIMKSHFDRAIQWNGSAPQPYIGLARLYIRQGNLVAAVNVLEEAVKLNSGHVIAQFELGDAYKAMGDYGKAIQHWVEGRACFPLAQLGDKLAAQGEGEEAQRAYEAAIAIDPSNRFAHWGLAKLYQERGAKDHAIQEFMEVIRLAPQLVWPYLEIGNTYRDAKDFEKALDWYQRAKTVDPDDLASYLAMARIYWTERHDKAKAVLELAKAIDLNPSVASPYIVLGNIHTDAQEYEEARYWYEKAAEIEPMNSLPYWALGFVFFKQGFYDEASRQFEEAAIRNPRDPEIHWWLAKVYALQADRTSALQELYQAISLGGENVGKYQETLRELEKERDD